MQEDANIKKEKTVIVVAGPTAVGKTALSLQLARHFNTAILSADSRQCYREMNIGVAKPSAEELALVKHYFINSHSIKDDVNAGTFEHYALQSVNEIFATNDIAVMVGGTGLYINAFCNGIDVMPDIPASIREEIIHQYQKHGLAWLQQQLQKDDPEFWQVAEQQNPQRLMRALEVIRATGLSILSFRKGLQQQRPFRIIKTALQLPREILNQRINQRVDQMMETGLLAEVESLLSYRELNALQTVGYRELFDYFDGSKSLSEAVEQIKINTRHYAKRQMTWFKKDKDITWFDTGDDNIIHFLENLLMQ